MSEIDVTPVEDIAEDQQVTTSVEDPPELPATTAQYVLYGGKGGVGKTTMAAATGVSSATTGAATLVISTDPAHSLSDIYETKVGTEPTPIDETLPLWGVEIDPETALDGGGPFGGITDGPESVGGIEPMELLMGGNMPGADEAIALQTLLEYLDDDRFDRVVVDTAPTGHTLRLLQLPEMMDTMLGRMLQWRERLTGLADTLGGMVGDDGPDPGGVELEELQEAIKRLRGVLQDPSQTDFRIVMIPEALSVVESRRLRRELETHSIPVSTVVVNKVMEPLTSATDAVPSDAVVDPNVEDCAFCSRRWEVQRTALQNAQDLFRDHDVKRVPLLAEEVRGRQVLDVVAACLQ